MTEGRPPWEQAHWPSGQGTPHMPSGQGVPHLPQGMPQGMGQWPSGEAGHGAGGPDTLSYPQQPSSGFSWRAAGDVPAQSPSGPPVGKIIAIVGSILAVLLAALAAYFVVPRLTAGSQAAPTTAAAPAAAPAPAPAVAPLTLTAAADCVSAPSKDAAGTTVSYGPERMVDGQPDTAWRCDGNGAGRSVRVTFDRSATVTQVGIVPGYAKTDGADGTDRYAQNRRIAQVRYTFDDGTTVNQTLDTAATNRAVQTVAVPGVTSSGMTVTIVRSVPGSAVGKSKASDRIAISELQVTTG